MRRSLIAIVLALTALSVPVTPAVAQPHKPDDIARARALDKEGAKAYQEGRYNDAIRFFEESHRLGGPPFELWNIAKCHLRLDQPEQAAEVLERYLATPNLPPDDQKEATQQLEELRKRPSTMTIASNPTGATVTVDGKPAEGGGRTPLTISVQPGHHTVTISHKDRAPWTKQVEAKYGRAIIIDAPLATQGPAEDRPPPPDNPYATPEKKPWAARALLGVVLPRFGSVGGDAGIGFVMSATYVLSRPGNVSLALGGLMQISGDAWKNTVNAPTNIQGCGVLQSPNSATAFGLFGLGTASIDVVPKLSVTALGGLGIATELIGADIGGDVFAPSCTTSPGARPALLLGSQIDYSIMENVRLTAMPITLQLHPSYAGVREAPRDASGLWMRATIAIGAGIDF